MGNAREPINLLLAKGNKHLTKEEIELRKRQEVKAKNDKIKAPSWLSKDAKKDFNCIVKQLKEIDIISNLDINCLAQFCYSKEKFIECCNKLNEQGMVTEIKDEDGQIWETKLNPFTKLQTQYFEMCRKCAIELGLTISSRCKLVVPKTPEKPVNKFNKFNSGSDVK